VEQFDMDLDFRTLPPRPRKTSLRLRSAPDGLLVRKVSWGVGPVPTIGFVFCCFWIVRDLWNLAGIALRALAPNGPNAAQLGGAAAAVLTGLAVPGAVVAAVFASLVFRWCARLGAYWQLHLTPDLWRLQSLFGLRTYGRVAPSEVHGLVVSRDGQVMADLGDARWEPVSGPQAPADASWLRDALARLLDRPADLPTIAVTPDDSHAAPTAAPASEGIEWPSTTAATVGEVLPASLVRNQPGTRLPFRLLPPPKERNPGVTCAILLWLVFVGLPFLWLLTIFVKLVAEPLGMPWLGGLLFLGLFITGLGMVERRRRFRLAHGPRLEISEHPILIGATCRASLFQRGPLALTFARVRLVCEEKASYTDGTVTRQATHQVHTEELWRGEALQLGPDAPLDEEFDVHVPDGSMHSFQSAHNWITWKLVVEVRVAGSWRPWRDEFPVVVQPVPAPEDQA
jgi:hypothetical protein